MKKTALLSLLILMSVFSCKEKEKETAMAAENETKKPNIIVIMSDDMGYSDIAPFGGEIETPNLTKLADNGVRFKQFYNTARCCPTRASLMTGCYPQQTGIGHMTNSPERPGHHNYGTPEYQGFLNTKTVTIAEVLKESGYSTIMSGKWHLGMSKEEYWPKQRGFEKFYGIVSGASNFFKPVYPRGIYKNNEPVVITDPDFYTTDAFTDNALTYIDEAKTEKPDQPFFLYLAYTAPHWPLQAPQDVVDKYKGRYSKGWGELRKERYARMKEMGIIDASWNLTEQDARSWDSLSEEKKKEMDLRMTIYAAMVDRMDQNIGRLYDHLEKKGELDNTFIIFLNDNGACAENEELGTGPASQLETKEGYLLSYGQAWANASNTPYREYKHWLHEGGMATPFIVHWPEGIDKNKNGNLLNQYGFLPDIMATCLDLADAKYPENYNGNAITPHSGKSMLATLKNPEKPIHEEPIFWEHEGNKSVRLGKFKLVQDWDKKNADNWELYDMELDRTETNNIIDDNKETADKLIGYYNEWATANNVMDWKDVTKILKSRRKNKKVKFDKH